MDHSHRSFPRLTAVALIVLGCALAGCGRKAGLDLPPTAAATPQHEGSWWPAWTAWLGERSSGMVPAPALGTLDSDFPALADAPGRYVLEQ